MLDPNDKTSPGFYGVFDGKSSRQRMKDERQTGTESEKGRDGQRQRQTLTDRNRREKTEDKLIGGVEWLRWI